MITIDMKMPTDCSSCLIRKIMGCKIANESGWLNNRRDERCLLKEVVRCEDCDNRECDGRAGTIVCGITGDSHSRLWFCADGERRESE